MPIAVTLCLAASGLLLDAGKKFRIISDLLKAFDQQFHRLNGFLTGQGAPQRDYLRKRLRIEELFLLARPRFRDVDGGEYASFGKFTIQDNLEVAGPFELLKYYFVHLAAGIDQRG